MKLQRAWLSTTDILWNKCFWGNSDSAPLKVPFFYCPKIAAHSLTPFWKVVVFFLFHSDSIFFAILFFPQKKITYHSLIHSIIWKVCFFSASEKKKPFCPLTQYLRKICRKTNFSQKNGTVDSVFRGLIRNLIVNRDILGTLSILINEQFYNVGDFRYVPW